MKASPGDLMMTKVFEVFRSNIQKVTNFRSTLDHSLNRSIGSLLQRELDLVNEMLSDPKMRAIFIDPDGIERDHKQLDVATYQAASSVKVTRSACDSASVVFLHSALDYAVSEYLKVVAFVDEGAFYERIKSRKVTFNDVAERGLEAVRTQLVREYFEAGDRDSLVKRVQCFHATALKGGKMPVLQSFKYDEQRIVALDNMRHQVVHGGNPVLEVAGIDDTIDHLTKLNYHFVAVLNESYQLRIDPTWEAA